MELDQPNDLNAFRKRLAELKKRSASQAVTLPPACYTSGAFLELEREEIFRKEWICLGRVEEIPKRGRLFHNRTNRRAADRRPRKGRQGARALQRPAVTAPRSSPRVTATPRISSARTTPGPMGPTASYCVRPTWIR